EIYWLDGATEKAVAMLQPFRPGRTLELALVQAAAGRYRQAVAAIREMPATNYPPGMAEAAAKILDSAPAKAAAPAALPYQDEVSGDYFQPISLTWFWHPTYAAVRRTEPFKKVARDL